MKILCIDDEPEILELLAEFLELLGMEVVTAPDAQQGLVAFLEESGAFDAVVTDMKMPNMSGLDLLKELRARGHEMPVVLASGQFDEDLDQVIREYGITAILAKPFILSKFKEVLDDVLEQRDGGL